MSPFGDATWEPVVERLRAVSPFLFIPCPGNAGDHLIYLATCEFFRLHGLEFELFSEERFLENRNVVYGGGGNFVPYYPDCSGFIEEHFDDFESFTLLPHTIAGHDDLLARMDGRFALFCREPFSEAHCNVTVGDDASVHLSHDLVFTLDAQRWASLRFPGDKLRKDIRWLKRQWELRRTYAHPRTTYFRTDVESVVQADKELNVDLSDAVQPPKGHRKYVLARWHLWCIAVGRGFLWQIRCSKADVIATDRLHVAIAATLLGRKVRFYSGSYFKNQALYEHSLKERFPQVEFVDV